MITVVRDSGGDWIAVYRDDKLLTQGHSIQEEDLLRILGIDYRWMEQDLGDENHPYGSHLPYDLNELKEKTGNPDWPCDGSGYTHKAHGNCPGYGTDRT